jgi:glycosyltransferase involved in cell wall biosynthesis
LRLILADIHPLEPFIVRSHQFTCRAVSFARHWRGPVELWLPGPSAAEGLIARRVGSPPPENFQYIAGPPPFVNFLGWQIATRKKFRRWCRSRIRELAARGENCVFYFRTLKLANTLAPELQRHGWKFVFEPHEIFCETGKNNDAVRRIEERVYRTAALLVPTTQALEKSLAEKFLPIAPMLVGPLGHNGVNFSVPDYDPTAPPEFFYVGSLHRWKGLDTAFAATADLGVPFHVVGDAGRLEYWREFCRERGFDHVQFHGQLPPEKIAAFYRPGTICLLPLSGSEIARLFTSPLKIFEYMAAGRPIVTGDVPAIREIATDGRAMRLAPVGDVAAWQSALKNLLADGTVAAQLAANARAAAKVSTWDERARPLVEKMRAICT